ncbi:TPA: type II secretion system protein GspD, partial [Candidatus Poribacteria bacterium]|nr:type II secretion system protein GspD [Candidatus Poribacteria bacterium]HEX30290.1 type II secretion system protein GspD [Candidatus Poribacteria bacterium]
SIKLSQENGGLVVRLEGSGKMEFLLRPSYYKGDKLVLFGDIPNSYCFVNGRRRWRSLNPPDERVEKVLLAQYTFNPPVTRLVFLLSEEVYPEVRSERCSLILFFPPNEPKGDQPIMDKIVTIRSEGETLGKMLRLLFEQYGANFIVEKGVDVNQKVTLNLRDVPLRVALRELLSSLAYRFDGTDGGIIRVTARRSQPQVKPSPQPPAGFAVKTFRLKYISPANIIRALSGTLPEGIKVTGDEASRTLILSGDEVGIKRLEPMVRKLIGEIDLPPPEMPVKREIEEKPKPIKRVFKIVYSDPEELKRIFTPLLSTQGKIEAITASKGGYEIKQPSNANGGYLIISDLPEVISAIGEELKKLDRPAPQVEIRAYIIERTISDEEQMGFSWNFGYRKRKLTLNGRSSEDTRSKGFLNLRYGTLSPAEFNAVLRMISSSSRARVLSNPSITVLEGQQARFHSGDQVGFSKVTIQQGIEMVETEFKDLGVVLTVTPHVKEGKAVMLVIDIQVSDLGELTKTGEPTISTREAQTEVLVRDGETLVIGGLTSERKIRSTGKTPLLGDIPLLKRLFTSHNTTSKRSEVIVFITPRIANPVGTAGNSPEDKCVGPVQSPRNP